MKNRHIRHTWRDPFLKRTLSFILLPISIIGLLGTLIPHPTLRGTPEPTGDLPYFFAVILALGLVLLVSSLRDTLSPWSRLYRLVHPELWRRVRDR